MTTTTPTPDPSAFVPSESGVVIVDKPAGWTSHQVVARVRRLLGTRRVGHAGTLDPMATGLLLLGANRATRLLGYLSRADKTYAATVRLGVSTLTDDAEGEPTGAAGAGSLDDDRIEGALDRLRGEIEQVPSAVSAIKVGGVRSYARVRAGHTVTLAARRVVIHRFAVLARRAGSAAGVSVVDLDVIIDCSTGTYVRALARDLGVSLGIGGHLTALRRTRVGAFRIEEAQSIEPTPDRLDLLAMADVARRSFAVLDVDERQAAAIRHGRRLPGVTLPGDPAAVIGPHGDFLALYRPAGSDAVPEAVFVD